MTRQIHRYRHCAVALCAGLLAFQCLGWLAAWHVARQEVRWTMRRAMDEAEMPVCHVTLPACELPGLRVDRHEIRLHGRLYDIRSQDVMGDSVRLALCHDVREERLFEVLGSLLATPDTPASGPVSPLRVWWSKWFGAAFLPPDAAIMPVFARQAPALRFVSPALLRAQTILSCWAPPPEF